MQIDAELLERSTKFERGRPLPSTKELHGFLEQLDRATCEGRFNDASRIEAAIRAMVPESNVYEGYLEDVGLQTFRVRTVSIERKGSGANIHTFHIKLEVLDGTDVVGVRDMELVSFLTPVNRARLSGAQHVGPRFWPF